MNGAKFSWEANAFLLLKVKKQKNLQTEINYSDLPNIGKVFYLDFFFFLLPVHLSDGKLKKY